MGPELTDSRAGDVVELSRLPAESFLPHTESRAAGLCS